MTSARNALPATIATARLTLRAPRLDDLADIVALANNAKMVETTATLPYPFSDSDGRDFIATADSAAMRAYAVANADDRFIGTVMFKFADGKPPEIGYWLGEPHWGQGYAGEMVRGLVEAVRHLPAFSQIVARVLAANPASVRVLEKSGFTVTQHTQSLVERHLGKPLLILTWSATP